MSFWNLFQSFKLKDTQDQSPHSNLYEAISALFPESVDEKEKQKVACISGLLARIIYVDLKVKEGELAKMQETLSSWIKFPDATITAICKLTLAEYKNLAGIENHLYTQTLRELLDSDQRYNLLLGLFAVAAGDGEVSAQESQEIRTICQGLVLNHQDFIAAQASVKDKLKALKS